MAGLTDWEEATSDDFTRNDPPSGFTDPCIRVFGEATTNFQGEVAASDPDENFFDLGATGCVDEATSSFANCGLGL